MLKRYESGGKTESYIRMLCFFVADSQVFVFFIASFMNKTGFCVRK
jgi:hypothetical protein